MLILLGLPVGGAVLLLDLVGVNARMNLRRLMLLRLAKYKSWELLGKAAARLPHSKSLLRNIMRDSVDDCSRPWKDDPTGVQRSFSSERRR